jgi:hypothetical protein
MSSGAERGSIGADFADYGNIDKHLGLTGRVATG